MNITVRNCPDKHFKSYVEDAVLFFADQLISNKRIRNNCTVNVRFDAKIDEYGFASIEEYNTQKKPRKFLIQIHPGLGARGILNTLAHEMVHVKQYIENETNDSLTVWKGRKINSDKVDYWIHPWELDAFGREKGLLYHYAVKNCLWEIFSDFKNPALPISSEPIRWVDHS